MMCNDHLGHAHNLKQDKEEDAVKKRVRLQELVLGYEKVLEGAEIARHSKSFVWFAMVVLLAWCTLGWVMWAQAESGCQMKDGLEPPLGWWPIVFGAMFLWAGTTLLLQYLQKPLARELSEHEQA